MSYCVNESPGVYNLRDEHDELLVQPDVLELWGCIFVQNGQTGAAHGRRKG